jgi:hypothetical protein
MSCLFESVCTLLSSRRELLRGSRYTPIARLARLDPITHADLPITHADLRRAVCEVLDTIKVHGTPLADWGVMETGKVDYVAHMRHTNSWGGGIEIAALAKALRVPIVVHQNDGSEYTFGRAYTKDPFRLAYTGTHYEPA